jgi:hypothetical protein
MTFRNAIPIVLGIVMGLFLMGLTMSASVPASQMQDGIPPVIKKLGTFRGSHFPGFAEFRVQKYTWEEFEMHLVGDPYEVLINVSNIDQAYRFEDKKNTDYSTLLFVNYEKEPLLIRQSYKEVVSSIRRGMEAMVK